MFLDLPDSSIMICTKIAIWNNFLDLQNIFGLSLLGFRTFVQYIKRTKCTYRIGNLIGCSIFSFPSQKFSLFHYFTAKRALFHYFDRKISVTNGHLSTTAIFFTGSPWYIHSCFNLSIDNGQRFRNCVPLFRPKRDQLEKYFLYSYRFIPI